MTSICSVSKITLKVINVKTDDIKIVNSTDFKKITVTYPVGILEITPGFSDVMIDNAFSADLPSGICTVLYNDNKEWGIDFIKGKLTLHAIITPDMIQEEHTMSVTVFCE